MCHSLACNLKVIVLSCHVCIFTGHVKLSKCCFLSLKISCKCKKFDTVIMVIALVWGVLVVAAG